MNRMTKMQESKDRIRKAAEIKKQQREEEIRKQVELKRKQLELQAKFSLNPTDKPNNFVHKLDNNAGASPLILIVKDDILANAKTDILLG
jgi:hypothetical protein